MTICIPTYNRSNFLIRQLNFLKNEKDSLHFRLKILVSDNCSEEYHRKKINEYFIENNFFDIFFQEHNIGLIGNSIFLFKKVNSDYVWFLGDDDILKTGILNKVYSVIRKNNNLNYIFINHIGFKNNKKNVVSSYDLSEFEGFNNSGSEAFLRFLNNHGTINMFMSANIYNTDYLRTNYSYVNRLPEIDDFLLFSYICSKEKTYIINECLIYNNLTEVTWSSRKREIFSISIPNKIIEFQKFGLEEKRVKETLFDYFNNGRGNFIYLLINIKNKKVKNILKYIRFSNIIFLIFNSFFQTIFRILKRYFSI